MARTKSVKVLYAVLCYAGFSLCNAPFALGQAVAVASINGQVADPTGAAVANATVTMTETETGVQKTTVTDSTGHYSLPDLPVGPYRLEVKAPGFKEYAQTGIVLQVGSNVTQNVTLQLGSITETVEVQASANMVETQHSSVAQVIDEKSVNNLPLNGRYVTQLVLLSGAAVTDTPAGSDLTGSKNFYSSTTISVAGGQANATNYMLDGGYYVDTFTNVNMPFPFPDALQEFSVETSTLPARNGLHPGGVVNAVTKSGTNQWHGDLFEFIRNGDVNAINYFANKQDSLKRNQFGGTFGGRIIRDKLFFFGGFQQSNIRQAPSASLAFVPTAAALTGNFSVLDGASCQANHLPRTIKDPVSGAPLAGDQISPTRFDPASLALVKYLPQTSDPCGRVTFGIPVQSDESQYVGRIDWNINSKHSLYGRYFLDDYTLAAFF